jgi:hypothetical protein
MHVRLNLLNSYFKGIAFWVVFNDGIYQSNGNYSLTVLNFDNFNLLSFNTYRMLLGQDLDYQSMATINPTMTQIIYGAYLFFCGILSMSILVALVTYKLKEYISIYIYNNSYDKSSLIIVLQLFYNRALDSVKSRVKCEQLSAILEFRNKTCIEYHYNLFSRLCKRKSTLLYERFDLLSFDYMTENCNPLVSPSILDEMKRKAFILKTRGMFKI